MATEIKVISLPFISVCFIFKKICQRIWLRMPRSESRKGIRVGGCFLAQLTRGGKPDTRRDNTGLLYKSTYCLYPRQNFYIKFYTFLISSGIEVQKCCKMNFEPRGMISIRKENSLKIFSFLNIVKQVVYNQVLTYKK